MQQESVSSEMPDLLPEKQTADVLLCITKSGEVRPFLVVEDRDDALEYSERV